MFESFIAAVSLAALAVDRLQADPALMQGTQARSLHSPNLCYAEHPSGTPLPSGCGVFLHSYVWMVALAALADQRP